MAMSEVIAGLGKGDKASKVLREHSIWKNIEKDACVLNILFRMSNNNYTSRNSSLFFLST